ncbi:MAG: hypothetical protein ACQERJ_09420 [Bacillota bacterium]
MIKVKLVVGLIVVILLSSFVCGPRETYSQGIILADNQQLINIFRSEDDKLVQQLAQDLESYDKVILHLGAKKVFTRGNAFFYRTSQENLIKFSKILAQNDQKLYLWFLDSFGAAGFSELYQNHQEIIDANYTTLQNLDIAYQGVVIDLEWINLQGNSDNSKKYLELINYLKNKFITKEVSAFASLIDNPSENRQRGYREQELKKKLDNLIAMLYIGDGGYYLKDGQLQLYLSANRVEDLRAYYQQQNYGVAVALAGRIILERNDKLYFIKSANQFKYQEQVELDYSREEKYVRVRGYSSKGEFEITRNDGVVEKIKADDRLHFIEIKEDDLVEEEDYIWEYFLLQE